MTELTVGLYQARLIQALFISVSSVILKYNAIGVTRLYPSSVADKFSANLHQIAACIGLKINLGQNPYGFWPRLIFSPMQSE